MSVGSILLVGKREEPHLGGSLYRAAQQLGLEVHFLSTQDAFNSHRLVRAFCWHVLGKRPPRLGRFSTEVVKAVQAHRPDVVLTTGVAPVTAEALREIGRFGATRLNYSTDDPWSPNHRASWFFEALPHYDIVFTPRHANEGQFRDLGCQTEYLPFGYDPDLFHPVFLSEEEKDQYDTDVVFVGGGDEDRLEFIASLINAGLEVSLYGGYWDQYDLTTPYTEGIASPEVVNKATQGADIALCLVRRANRDDHVMRSFEIPAIGSCMLVEDTGDHRRLFGKEEKRVVYFDSPDTLVKRAKELRNRSRMRKRLAEAVHKHIVEDNHHTYRTRLETMIAKTTQLV